VISPRLKSLNDVACSRYSLGGSGVTFCGTSQMGSNPRIESTHSKLGLAIL